MPRTYKITLKNHIYHLGGVIAFYPLLFIYYIFFDQHSKGLVTASLSSSTIVISIALLPILVLHINYLIANFGYQVVIDSQIQTIVIKTKKHSYYYQWSDIIKIEVFGDIHGKNLLPFNRYMYSKLYFTDKRTFYLTSLLIHKISIPIPANVIGKLHIYPIIIKN